MRKPIEASPKEARAMSGQHREALLSSSGTQRASGPEAARGGGSGPLDARDLAVLSSAAERMRALRRVTRLALANGWGFAACALFCLPFAAFDAALLPVVIVLGAAAFVELRGAIMLRRCDLRAPRWLALNQLALLGAIAVYCAIGAASALHAPSPAAQLRGAAPDVFDQLQGSMPGLTAGNGAIDSAYHVLVLTFYGAVFAASVLYQGGCAYYYRSRAALLRAHVSETPAWVLEVERRLNGW